MNKIEYCTNCVYPNISVNNCFDDDGVCNACILQDEFNNMDDSIWKQREKVFHNLIKEKAALSESNYDCVIPVSGGKDSYYQTAKCIEYGMKPLLVTYHGNNYLPEGQRNLDRMREVFNVDHIVFGPGVKNLVDLNKTCFKVMGDMNWHAHAGIKIFPMQIAVKFNIPLVIWGEITWSVAGMFSSDDYVQYNKRTVFEHDMRGYTIEDITKQSENLTVKDLPWLQMPSDEDIRLSQTTGIYIGNFFNWNPNKHAKEMQENFGFEFAQEPFERTYRTMSNLDDMHENGIHDYMKFIKFGYSRASDHASKDIRSGYISREKGIEYVKKYDHVKPQKDLQRWLKYVDMTEEEFDTIADSFRSPRVWRIENGEWVKDNVWGCSSSYGSVKLDKSEWSKYQIV